MIFGALQVLHEFENVVTRNFAFGRETVQSVLLIGIYIQLGCGDQDVGQAGLRRAQIRNRQSPARFTELFRGVDQRAKRGRVDFRNLVEVQDDFSTATFQES